MIDGKPRIGDEVYIHGYIDEIRNDVVIIRNEGGYFGTSDREIFYYEEDERGYGTMNEADRKTEPQTNADQHVQRVEYVGNDEKSRCWTCKHFERMHETPISSDGSYYTYVVCTASECRYEPKDEPQTDCDKCQHRYDGTTEFCRTCGASNFQPKDEPQTDCAWR